jgi:hypothetical protein
MLIPFQVMKMHLKNISKIFNLIDYQQKHHVLIFKEISSFMKTKHWYNIACPYRLGTLVNAIINISDLYSL